MSAFRRILASIGIILLCILMVLGMLVVVARSARVQTAAASVVAEQLSRALGAKVGVRTLDYKFPNRLLISGVLVEDQQADTLLYLDTIAARADLRKLLTSDTLCIRAVNLQGGYANVYRLPDSTLNYTFLLRAFRSDSPKQRKPLPFNIQIDDIALSELYVDYLQWNAYLPDAKLHLHTLSSSLVDAEIERLTLYTEHNGLPLDVDRLEARVVMTDSLITFPKLHVELPHSDLRLAHLAIHRSDFNALSPSAPSGEEGRGKGALLGTDLCLHIDEATLTPADLAALVPALRGMRQPWTFSAALDGRVDSLEATNLRLAYRGQPVLSGNVTALGLPAVDSLYLRAHVDDLHANRAILQDIVSGVTGRPVTLPDMLARLGQIHYRGTLEGRLSDLNLLGAFTTDLGSIRTDGHAAISLPAANNQLSSAQQSIAAGNNQSSIGSADNPSSSSAAHQSSIAVGNLSFRGTLSTRRFDLGRLLAMPDMGTVALSVTADGSLRPDHPFAGHVVSSVDAFTFRDYTYRDIRLDSHITGKNILADVTSSDANIAFRFAGNVDLRPAQPVYDLALRLEHFRPGPLHLSEKYSRLDLALRADVDLTGATIDDIDGLVRLDSITIRNADRALFIPELELRAENPQSSLRADRESVANKELSSAQQSIAAGKSLSLFSPYLNGNLSGHFSYSTLPTSVLRCIARYLPKAFDTSRERQLLAARPDNELEFYLYANRLNELTSILDLPVSIAEMSTLKGSLSDHSGHVLLQAVAPDLTAAGRHIEDLTLSLDNNSDRLNLALFALLHQSGSPAGRHMGDLRFYLNAHAADDILHAGIDWSNPDTVHNGGKFRLTTSLSRYDNRPLITAHIHPSSFFLADSLWTVADAHVIYSAADTAIQVDGFRLSSSHQSVYANGIISRNPADSIYAELRSIDLDYLLGALTNVHSALWFGGTVTGWATGYGLLREPMFEANVEMLHGAINGAEIGNVYASAILDRQRKTVLIQGDVYDDRLPAVHVSIDDLPARRVFSSIPYPSDATAFTPYKSGLPSFAQSSIAPALNQRAPLEINSAQPNNQSSIAFGNNQRALLEINSAQPNNQLASGHNQLSSHPASSRKGRHTVHLDGEVGGAPGRWGLDIYPDSVDLGFVNYWVGSFLSDLRGHATGTVRIRGGKQHDGRSFTTVSLAALPASDASFVLPFTGARYFVSDSILMDSTSIRFPALNLRDVEGNPVAFRGAVTHDGRFNDIHVDLTAEPRSAIVLDIPDDPDEDFSGRVYANGIATVRGPVSDLAVTATATTAARSRFTLSLAGSSSAHTSDFISFVDHTPLHQSSIHQSSIGSADNLTAAPKGAVTLSLQINVTPEATVSVLLDKRTGDRLQGRGEGDVRFTYVYPTGDMSLFGGLTLQQGTFGFTFQNVIRREFQIAEGSSVRWNGIPEDPELDVRALYRVTASLRDLFGTEASSVTSRSNIPVSCVLNLSESLNSPLIRFGLEFPSSDESVASQVRSVINTDEMLTREVLYLLVFNRFYTPDYLSASQANLGVNETYSLISSTVTGQINSWINKLTDKFSVGFNMRTDGEGANASQEYEAQFEIQPLRGLLINGNVGYRYNDIANQPYFGNLDVEYMLTPNGKFRAKAYTHTVDKYSLRQANTVQGVGFVFKHDFNWPAAERRLRRSQSLSPDTLNLLSDTINARIADPVLPSVPDSTSLSE